MGDGATSVVYLRPDWVVDPIRCSEPNSTPAQQRSQANLVQESLAGDGFADHPDHKTEPGGAAVDQVHPWQLFRVALGGSRGF